MRPLGEVISCQISFNPIKSNDYTGDIEKVISIIKSSDLECGVGLLSTTVRGEKGKVFDLLLNIFDSMNKVCGFSIDIKLSNICGCSNHE